MITTIPVGETRGCWSIRFHQVSRNVMLTSNVHGGTDGRIALKLGDTMNYITREWVMDAARCIFPKTTQVWLGCCHPKQVNAAAIDHSVMALGDWEDVSVVGFDSRYPEAVVYASGDEVGNMNEAMNEFIIENELWIGSL